MRFLSKIFGQRLRVRVDRLATARPMTEQERAKAIARFLKMPVADQLAQSGRFAKLLGLTGPSSRLGE
jgi:hypothetical protein